MYSLILLSCAFCIPDISAYRAPIYRTADNVRPGEYIVLLKPGNSLPLKQRITEIEQHMKDAGKDMGIITKYHFQAFAAFFTVVTEEAIEVLRGFPDIALVQENSIVTVNDVSWQSEVDLGNCVNQSTDEYVLWGLTRTSSEKRADYSTGFYHYDEQGGRDVSAYIIDTGIYMEHEEFQGRVVWGYTAVNFTHEGNVDLNGHGTHVAGTVGGSTFGIAKMVRLIAVKVFDKDGTSKITSTIEGVIWTCNHFVDNRQRDKRYKGVVNMSLGANGTNTVLETLISACVDAGLTFVAAAGNDNIDACLTNPARIASVITVGAANYTDTFASFSNYGPCVDILAPGVDIVSSWISHPTSASLLQGTSMAAPHVAGVIARYLSGHHENPSPHQIKAWLLDIAAKDDIEIDVNKITTPNRMLYMSCASEYCQSGTCSNRGVCEETDGGFICDCKEGFKGIQCQTETITVETESSYDDTTLVALLAVTLTLVILLFLVAIFLLIMNTGLMSKMSVGGKSHEEPYKRQDDSVSVS